jgi:hypothetical protein
LSIPVYSLYLLLKDIIHFYFTIYTPGFPADLITPSFALSGIAFSPDESPAIKQKILEYEYSHSSSVNFAIPFSPEKRQTYLDETIRKTDGDIIPQTRQWELVKDAVLPDTDRQTADRFSAAFGLARTLDRQLIEEVATSEISLVPKPETEWELVHVEAEGRVYHRRGGPFERVRSVGSTDFRPNEQFTMADLKLVENSRNRVVAEVNVPNGDRPALLTFSRPYFRGYKAKLDSRHLEVTSDRGLFPTVKVSPGARGELTLVYRPWWLRWGGMVALLSTLTLLSPLLLKS